MRGRRGARWTAVALGIALLGPAGAEAQVAVRVDWNVGNRNVRVQGTWSNVPVPQRGPRGAVVPVRGVRFVPVRGVRFPRGHRPPPGECRLWYPGVPPGRQPAPRPCTALHGAFHPDVVVVTWRGVVRPVWGGGAVAAPHGYREGYRGERWDRRDRWRYDRRYDDRWDDDDFWDDDDWDDDWWDDDWEDDRWDDDDWEDDHRRWERGPAARRGGPGGRRGAGPPGRGRGRGGD